MFDDLQRIRPYSDYMGEDGAHVRLYLGTDEPIALTDFVGSFVGIGNQFEKFIAAERPELKAETEFFVKEVRSGSVQADLVAVVTTVGLPGIIDTIDKAQILAKFVGDIRERISKYFVPGGRDVTATKSDLNDFLKTVSGISRDPKATALIESAVFEDGKRDVRAAFHFKASEARIAQQQISEHRKELEAKSGEDCSRVLLRFVRPSIEAGKPGRKTGERGLIDKLHPKPLPIFYASDMAEEHIRHELLAIEGNVFRHLFDVDVNIERSASGKPIAYRITHLHQVIEGDPENGDDG